LARTPKVPVWARNKGIRGSIFCEGFKSYSEVCGGPEIKGRDVPPGNSYRSGKFTHPGRTGGMNTAEGKKNLDRKRNGRSLKKKKGLGGSGPLETLGSMIGPHYPGQGELVMGGGGHG